MSDSSTFVHLGYLLEPLLELLQVVAVKKTLEVVAATTTSFTCSMVIVFRGNSKSLMSKEQAAVDRHLTSVDSPAFLNSGITGTVVQIGVKNKGVVCAECAARHPANVTVSAQRNTAQPVNEQPQQTPVVTAQQQRPQTQYTLLQPQFFQQQQQPNQPPQGYSTQQ
ncbi:hypothetical protein Taro_001968 [Colocasia esculenta]|uniref:Uncharacterized protein n=1 Tax=Colocasia esculenta TaxID=4460 RepID=A0A843TJM0_COLES|nr:hypothetical protein [Colocasia esculenta]